MRPKWHINFYALDALKVLATHQGMHSAQAKPAPHAAACAQALARPERPNGAQYNGTLLVHGTLFALPQPWRKAARKARVVLETATLRAEL